VVELLLVQLLLEDDPSPAEKARAKAELINTFWEEYERFAAHVAPFDRDHIWMDESVAMPAHVWHKINSLRYTHVLGRFACLVTSKILGIGSAERCWGDVKRIKSGQRSHLQGNKTAMQGTLYGSYCMEKARIRRETNLKHKTRAPVTFWEDSDFEDLGLSRYGVDIRTVTGARKPTRIIRLWLEDWELAAIKQKDPAAEARLLEKYGGIKWVDIDVKGRRKPIYTAHHGKMSWDKDSARKEQGWTVLGTLPGFDFDPSVKLEEQDDYWWPWSPGDALFTCIRTYYSNPAVQAKYPHIVLVEQPVEEDEDFSDEEEEEEAEEEAAEDEMGPNGQPLFDIADDSDSDDDDN